MCLTNNLDELVSSRIEVKPPYYALKNLQLFGDTLRSDIFPEQYVHSELSPIPAGETARHLAILGSCSLSLKEQINDKHFFLAKKAKLNRISTKAISANKLLGYADTEIIEKRKGIAKTYLETLDGEKIYSLDVEYLIIPKNIFERQYKEFKVDLRKQNRETTGNFVSVRQNPYKQKDILNKYFESITIDAETNTLTALMSNINPIQCMGHFPMFPALPIAFIAYYICSLTEILLHKMLKKRVRFFAKYSDIDAYKLIFINMKIKFEIMFIKNIENNFYFTSYIRSYI